MQNEVKIDFEKSGYQLVDRQNITFKAKGKNNQMVLFKKIGTNDYFVFESGQFESTIKEFLSFCLLSVHPFFYKFKYGDEFFKEAKEFHEDNQQIRFERSEKPKSFEQDLKEFQLLAEEEFQDGLGQNNLFPAIIIKKGSPRWEQYDDFIKNKLPPPGSSFLTKQLKDNNTAVFCLNEDNSISLLKHFTKDLNYRILRGKKTIGNLIEINYGTIKLLLDCGKELDGDLAQLSEVEKQVLSNSYDGILISHYHLDHAGLIDKAKGQIFMGEGCLSVLNAQIKYKNGQTLQNINCFQPNKEFSIKKSNFELKIKPILVDHSAYDSYMFLISGGEKTLLYTGDFRANGRKSFLSTLNNLPNKVDYLICEATNMFSKKQNLSELQLEKQATKLMRQYKRVFVFQAGTNIDRLVTFYKASRSNNKAFFIDTYVAAVTENLKNIPNVKTFKDVFCFWDVPKRIKEGDEVKYEVDWRLQFKTKNGIGSYEIGEIKNSGKKDFSNFTMLIRPSMLSCLKRIDEDKKKRFHYSIFDDSILIYSLWEGYKEKEDVKNFLEEIQKLGVKVINLHTSGHADKQTIDRLKEKTNPSVIEYVHYFEQ